MIDRRTFLQRSAMAAFVRGPVEVSAGARHEHIGYTGITWMNAEVEQAIETVSRLGLFGFETFGDVLTKWEAHGGLGAVLARNKLPLISGYCTMNLTEGGARQAEVGKAIEYARLIRGAGGKIYVLGPNQVKRDTYDFKAAKTTVVASLNEIAKAVHDHGLTPVLHQHTGTCIESRDETYAILDAVDSSVLKFGPDVGQLTKGGQDALKVVRDYLPLVQHMHLKDYNGKDDHLLGYCPLGQGKVDVPGILNLMAGRTLAGMVMIELDNNPPNPSPTPPATLATESRDYLRTLGVQFRA